MHRPAPERPSPDSEQLSSQKCGQTEVDALFKSPERRELPCSVEGIGSVNSAFTRANGNRELDQWTTHDLKNSTAYQNEYLKIFGYSPLQDSSAHRGLSKFSNLMSPPTSPFNMKISGGKSLFSPYFSPAKAPENEIQGRNLMETFRSPSPKLNWTKEKHSQIFSPKKGEDEFVFPTSSFEDDSSPDISRNLLGVAGIPHKLASPL